MKEKSCYALCLHIQHLFEQVRSFNSLNTIFSLTFYDQYSTCVRFYTFSPPYALFLLSKQILSTDIFTIRNRMTEETWRNTRNVSNKSTAFPICLWLIKFVKAWFRFDHFIQSNWTINEKILVQAQWKYKEKCFSICSFVELSICYEKIFSLHWIWFTSMI
jgi:hypothetical protein